MSSEQQESFGECRTVPVGRKQAGASDSCSVQQAVWTLRQYLTLTAWSTEDAPSSNFMPVFALHQPLRFQSETTYTPVSALNL